MQIGTWNELKIDRIKEIGAYLTDGEEDVLLPVKQLPEKSRIGDMLRVFLYRDSKDRLIATVHEPYIEMGQLRRLRVKSVAGFGAFIRRSRSDRSVSAKAGYSRYNGGGSIRCAD